MWADARLFLVAIGHDWVALLTGIASVVLSCLGAVGVGKVPSSAFWIAAGTCLLVSSFRVWRKEHHVVVELQVEVPLRIAVHGIPAVWQEGSRSFFVVPDVTITNPAHQRIVSIGARLWVSISGGGEVCCPPEPEPLTTWETLRGQYANRHLVFPLNLPARHTARGYIAFRGDVLHGVAHQPQVDAVTGLRHYACRIEFTDYLGQPAEAVIYKENTRIGT